MTKLLLLLSLLLPVADGTVFTTNLGSAPAGAGSTLQPAQTAALKIRCVRFQYWQDPAANPVQVNVPVSVTSVTVRLAGFQAATTTAPVTAAETAQVTIRDATTQVAATALPGATRCVFNGLTGIAASDASGASPYTTTPTTLCLLPTGNTAATGLFYFLCVESLTGSFRWESVAANPVVPISGDNLLGTFLNTFGWTESTANFAAPGWAPNPPDNTILFSSFQIDGVLAFSPSPVTTPRPSPSPVTPAATTPVNNDGSDSALYGLFALIALPILLAIAGLAACWYFLTRRPAGLELQEQVPRQYQQVPPPTPAPAVPYFPSVYAPGAYMPAPGMVLPPAYAF